MKVIAFGTLKGGTGKTTVSFNVGGILGERKKKVLFIDLDPQANLSANVGIEIADQSGATIRDVFANPRTVTPADVITKCPMPELPNIDIIASHIRLTATELQLVQIAGRERILQRWIERNEEALSVYDYIIIDTNPSMGIVNQNGFVIADSIVLVSDVSMASFTGAQLFAFLWGEACENLGITEKISAIILNNFDYRLNLARDAEEFCRRDEDFGELVLKTVIPYRKVIKESGVDLLPLNKTAPKSDACKAFRGVVKELRERKVL